jgi:hypothetical protein
MLAIFGYWPPVLPSAGGAQLVTGFAFINADGTVAFDTGFIDEVVHVGLSGFYEVKILPAFQDPNLQCVVSRSNASPGMIDGTPAAVGTVINVNTYNASASATEFTFTVCLLKPAP